MIKKILLLGVFVIVGCLATAKAQNQTYQPYDPSMLMYMGSKTSQGGQQSEGSQNPSQSANIYNMKQIASDMTSNNDFQLSPIEQLFNSDIGTSSTTTTQKQQPLKQIGYDLFSASNVQGFGKYDGSYVLSIGESINVYSWGDSVDMLSVAGSPILSPLTKTQVDSKGTLFISGIGTVKAEGKSIAQVEQEIQALASKKFTNVRIKATVAEASSFSVFVYGYVNKPGQVAVSNNSSMVEALAAAGGVNKNGSLRNITYKTYSGSKKNVDLYKALFKGEDAGVRLKPNDTIFVNSIGSVTAIKNGVKIPGIYETTSSDSLADLVNYAGGLLPSTDKSSVNLKAYRHGQRVSRDITDLDFDKTKLANGDILEFHNVYGKAEDYVSIEGNVKHPCVVAYKKGMKLSDLLKNKNELQDETLIYQAVIKRVSGDGKIVVSVPISLEDYFHGGNDPVLKPQDTITVYKSTNANFIEVYGCIDKPKQMPYNDKLTLKDVMADVHFIKASPKSETENVNHLQNIAMISSDNEIIPASDVVVEITNTNPSLNIDNSYYNNSSNNNSNNDNNKNITGKKGFVPPSQTRNFDNNNGTSIKTVYLYDILVQSDNLSDIKIAPGDKILFRPLRDDEVVKTVKMSGYVNKPGVYKFVEGKRLSDMVEAAGGLTREADLRGVVFQRACLKQKGQEMLADKNEKDIKQLQGQMTNNNNANDVKVQQEALETISDDSASQATAMRTISRISLNIKNNDLNKLDEMNNIEVQDGDEIYIPKYSNHVMVIGEVYNETSFVYKKGEKASYYIKMVGGYTPNARRLRLYKIGVNGRAVRLNLIAANKIEAGDTIVVPRRIKANDWITPTVSTFQAIASLLTSVFIVTKW